MLSPLLVISFWCSLIHYIYTLLLFCYGFFCCILIFHVLICSFSIGCLDILMTCLFLSNSDYSIMLTAIPQFLSCNPLLIFVLLTNLCHITVIQMIGFPGYQFRFNSSFSTKGNVCNKSGRCHLFFIRFICLSFCFCFFIRDLLLWTNLELSHILWGLTWAISSWLSVMEYPSGSMRPPQGFDDVLWCSVFRFLWCHDGHICHFRYLVIRYQIMLLKSSCIGRWRTDLVCIK